jgi:hypothetical protein
MTFAPPRKHGLSSDPFVDSHPTVSSQEGGDLDVASGTADEVIFFLRRGPVIVAHARR